MEKGAIVNNGEGYYLRGAGEHGSDLPIYEIQEGSYCYNANGELCLIGEDKQAKKIIWGKQTTVTGGLNRPVEIEIAKDESGNDILINGQPILKPGSQEKYLDQVGDGIEEEKPLDDKKWIIGGELVAPGSSGAKGEGVSGNTGKGSNVVEGSSKAGFKSQELLDSHFKKHAGEFGSITKEQYLKGAQDLVKSKPGGDILIKTRANGDTLVYNKATNEFATKTKDGIIRTYFKPTDGLDYFNRQ